MPDATWIAVRVDVLHRGIMTTHELRRRRSVYRIQFKPLTDMGVAEDILLLSILVVGCLHGDAAVRLETGYAVDADARVIVMDVGGRMAISVARIFIGLCSHEFGIAALRVIRGDSPAPGNGAHRDEQRS